MSRNARWLVGLIAMTLMLSGCLGVERIGSNPSQPNSDTSKACVALAQLLNEQHNNQQPSTQVLENLENYGNASSSPEIRKAASDVLSASLANSDSHLNSAMSEYEKACSNAGA